MNCPSHSARTDSFSTLKLNSKANPRSMWRSLHRILHSRPQQHYSDAECQSLVTSFNTFFISKIANIHQSIANTLASSSTSSFPPRQFSGASLSTLPPVSPIEVLKAISALSNKASPLDPLPTSILKKYSPILSPILSKLANLQERPSPPPIKKKNQASTPAPLLIIDLSPTFPSYRNC